MIATIQPMHGNSVAIYSMAGEKTVIDTALHEGHAIGLADFDGSGSLQVVAGRRNPDKANKVGIKIYSNSNSTWHTALVDDNGMACEDLQVADLDGNGKPDIIAAGRATKNVKIYWNK